jgi:hypothetical protein
MTMARKSYWILVLMITLFGCQSKEEKTQAPSMNDHVAAPSHETSAPLDTQKMVSTQKEVTEKVPVVQLITFNDPINKISLQYPSTWRREPNKYVPFKILAPQESAVDTIQENFYYKVIETPNNGFQQTMRKTLKEMAAELRADLIKESASRSNLKILEERQVSFNGWNAYMFVNSGDILGVPMKYKIYVIENFGKEYLLFYAAEQRSYERFLQDADIIFQSVIFR